MAGPLVFCLTLGSFLLLVSEFCFHFSFYYVTGFGNIGQFVRIQLDFYLSTEWQSAFLIHLRHRRTRLHCVLCTFDGDGDASIGDIGCSHFSAGILPAANGRTIRHQCTRRSPVSTKNDPLWHMPSHSLIGIFTFAEELLESYSRPFVFCGAQFRHRNFLWPHTQWIISRFWLHIRVLFYTVYLHW